MATPSSQAPLPHRDQGTKTSTTKIRAKRNTKSLLYIQIGVSRKRYSNVRSKAAKKA
jgi:hypothetical protein